MSDQIQTMVDAKLNAIALTRAALTRDDAALRDLLEHSSRDELLDTCGNLVSLAATLLSMVTDMPVESLDQWARQTVDEAVAAGEAW